MMMCTGGKFCFHIWAAGRLSLNDMWLRYKAAFWEYLPNKKNLKKLFKLNLWYIYIQMSVILNSCHRHLWLVVVERMYAKTHLAFLCPPPPPPPPPLPPPPLQKGLGTYCFWDGSRRCHRWCKTSSQHCT